MLVLSRHEGETITLGDDQTVTVISIKGSKVRLGIEAPKSVPVHRHEIACQLSADQLARRDTDPQLAAYIAHQVIGSFRRLVSREINRSEAVELIAHYAEALEGTAPATAQEAVA